MCQSTGVFITPHATGLKDALGAGAKNSWHVKVAIEFDLGDVLSSEDRLHHLSISKLTLHLHRAQQLEGGQHGGSEVRDGIIAASGQQEPFEPLPHSVDPVQVRAVGGQNSRA